MFVPTSSGESSGFHVEKRTIPGNVRSMIDPQGMPPWLVRGLTSFFPSALRFIRNELKDCSSVLDLGCGKDSPLLYAGQDVKTLIGVDRFVPYLQAMGKRGRYQGLLQADLNQLPFAGRTFDACVSLSVLEHLDKEDGLRLLEKMESHARKRVLVIVPNGDLGQDEYDENPYQLHRSSWTPSDFESRGYRVRGIRGLRSLRGERALPRYRPAMLWFLVSQLSQFWTYWHPNQAFEIGAVKDLR